MNPKALVLYRDGCFGDGSLGIADLEAVYGLNFYALHCLKQCLELLFWHPAS